MQWRSNSVASVCESLTTRFYASLEVITKKKPVMETEKVKRKESKYTTTKDS